MARRLGEVVEPPVIARMCRCAPVSGAWGTCRGTLRKAACHLDIVPKQHTSKKCLSRAARKWFYSTNRRPLSFGAFNDGPDVSCLARDVALVGGIIAVRRAEHAHGAPCEQQALHRPA